MHKRITACFWVAFYKMKEKNFIFDYFLTLENKTLKYHVLISKMDIGFQLSFNFNRKNHRKWRDKQNQFSFGTKTIVFTVFFVSFMKSKTLIWIQLYVEKVIWCFLWHGVCNIYMHLLTQSVSYAEHRISFLIKKIYYKQLDLSYFISTKFFILFILFIIVSCEGSLYISISFIVSHS